MSPPGHGEGAPAQAPLVNDAAAKLQVPDQRTTNPQDSTTRHAQQVRGCFVLVVETPGDRYRRRTFLTLAAAERAVDRARLAGHASSVLLCRLVPVAVVA